MTNFNTLALFVASAYLTAQTQAVNIVQKSGGSASSKAVASSEKSQSLAQTSAEMPKYEFDTTMIIIIVAAVVLIGIIIGVICCCCGGDKAPEDGEKKEDEKMDEEKMDGDMMEPMMEEAAAE